MLRINNYIQIPLTEIEFSYARSGGPGGQNVNKVNSKAVLRWPVLSSNSLPYDVKNRFLTKFANRVTTDGDLIVSSQKSRDQISNAEDCLAKLQEMVLSVASPPVPRRPTKPTKASKVRRIKTKSEHSQKKSLRRKPTIND